MPNVAAARTERELARRPRARGIGVWQNYPQSSHQQIRRAVLASSVGACRV